MKFSWEYKQFDSDILGFKVAKITGLVSAKYVIDMIEDLRKNSITYATYRLPSNKFSIIQELEKNNFIIVDGIIALELNNLTKTKQMNQSSLIRDAQISDINNLKNIAKTVFTQNRFFSDPLIAKNRASRIYTTWTENSVKKINADKVLVYSEKNTIKGFISLQKKGHIDLLAVNKNYQGQGIAKKLIYSSFAYFKQWEVEKLQIETLITNIPALRAYISCGFKITDSFLTFRWGGPYYN